MRKKEPEETRAKPQEGREEERGGDEGRRAWPVVGLITFDYLCYQRGHMKCYRTIETLALRHLGKFLLLTFLWVESGLSQ